MITKKSYKTADVQVFELNRKSDIIMDSVNVNNIFLDEDETPIVFWEMNL